MTYAPYDPADGPRVALKILIAGGFGVGKTTMVGSVSEIRPLRTEEVLTDAGIGVDDINGIEAKNTTTLAIDFARITFPDGIALYLFGTPAQQRLWLMCDKLCHSPLGAGALADTRRLTASLPAIHFFQRRKPP